jgi:hypothetical protein
MIRLKGLNHVTFEQLADFSGIHTIPLEMIDPLPINIGELFVFQVIDMITFTTAIS